MQREGATVDRIPQHSGPKALGNCHEIAFKFLILNFIHFKSEPE